jgi:AraC family transcriptional regulator, transcriptional activator of pobA
LLPEDRPSWLERLSALGLKLRQRRDGYQEAVLAHLTLQLMGVSRLAADVVGDLRLKDEHLLAEVFGRTHSTTPLGWRRAGRP